MDLPDIIPSCHPAEIVFTYKGACCYRGVVTSISGDLATVEWIESFPPEEISETSGITIADACINCLMPTGVEPVEKWLCIGDNVLVLDSNVLVIDEVPVSNSDRFLIIGLDHKFHSYVDMPACFLTGAGFAFYDAKYDAPYYAEQEILDGGLPTGLTECVPVNPDPANTSIPLGTETNSGKIITVVTSSNTLVPIKPFMIPNFYNMSDYCEGEYRPLWVNGYLYSTEPDALPRPSLQWTGGPVAPDYDYWSGTHDLSPRYVINLMCPRSGLPSEEYSITSAGVSVDVEYKIDTPLFLEHKGDAITATDGVFRFCETYSNITGIGTAWTSYHASDSGGHIKEGIFVGSSGIMYLQDHLLSFAITPTFSLDGSLSLSITSTEPTSPIDGTTAIDYDHTYTFDHGPALTSGQDGYGLYDYTWEDVVLNSVQTTVDACSGSHTLRSYPGIVSTIDLDVSRTQDREIYRHYRWNTETNDAPEYTAFSETSSFNVDVSAVAQYKINGVVVGVSSVVGSLDIYEESTGTPPDTYTNEQTISQSGLMVLGSSADASCVVVLFWDMTDSYTYPTAVSPTVNFSVKLINIPSLSSQTLESWSYTHTSSVAGFYDFSTTGINLGMAKVYQQEDVADLSGGTPPGSVYWNTLDGTEWWYYLISNEGITNDLTHVPPHYSFNDTSWSDSNTCAYKFGIAAPVVYPGIGHIDEMVNHLISKMNIHTNGHSDAFTGFPASTVYNSGDNTFYSPVEIVQGKDGRQMLVRYTYESTVKERYFLDFVEIDINVVKQL